MTGISVLCRGLLLGLVVVGVGGCMDAPRSIEGAVRTRTEGLIVQANSTLFAPGYRDAPALVIFSANPRTAPPALKPLVDTANSLKGTSPADPGEAVLARTMTDETYRRGHIERYPPTVAGNAETYLAHVMIRRNVLHEGLLRGRPLIFDLYTVQGQPVRLDLVGESPGRP